MRLKRDAFGRFLAPVRVWLTAECALCPPPSPPDITLRIVKIVSVLFRMQLRIGVVTSLFPEWFPLNKSAIYGNQHKTKEALISKKDKMELLPEDDVQAVIAMVPKLEKLLETYKEVTKEYQKYRKNGGDEIPGLEKHLGCSKTACCCRDGEEKVVKIENATKQEIAEKKEEER